MGRGRLFPPWYRFPPDLPAYVDTAYNVHKCNRNAWENFYLKYSDVFAKARKIAARRAEEIRKRQEKYFRDHGVWPTSWIINPQMSTFGAAAKELGRNEPIWPCYSDPYYEPYRLSQVAYLRPAYPDPLALDLRGDGIETVSVNGFAPHFDYEGDGFGEQTGWVGPHDGVLAMDRNGDGVINDGKELFSNETILKDGTKATNGFQALAELDSNKDGKIDAADPAYWQIRVLQGFDGDGYEVHTLNELGIRSINLFWTTAIITDPQGNTQFKTGSFEWLDGTTGQIAEYGFQTERSMTIPTEWREVPADIAALPYLCGDGNVYDLDQAMVRDTSGELKSLVEQFVSASDPNSRNHLMEQILFKWTGTENIDPTSRGGNIDARKIAVLEKFVAGSFVGVSGPNPNYAAAVLLDEAYRRLFETMYEWLMGQTHLKDLYQEFTFRWDDENQLYVIDATDVVTVLQDTIASNPEHGKQLLAEFARCHRRMGYFGDNYFLSVRETFIQQDPSLGWVFDSGGLPVYEHRGQGIRPWSPHIEGTDNADAVKGSLSEGDGFLNGLSGNDVIYGTSRDETLINGLGDAVLVAGGGNDRIWAGEGNDILDGGEGNDQLLGEAGNDTYLFRRGSGQDTIIDRDATTDNMDTIWLGWN